MARTTRQVIFNQADVEAFMHQVVTDHVDPLTGEVNATHLAEDAAHQWGNDRWLDDPQHAVWDIAVDVAEAHEKDTLERTQTEIFAFAG